MSFLPGQLEGLGGQMENQIENPLLQKTPEAPGAAPEVPRRSPGGNPKVPRRYRRGEKEKMFLDKNVEGAKLCGTALARASGTS